MTYFGELLKHLRIQSGLTQKQLAEKLCVSTSVISYYEQSVCAPSAEMLVKIANGFHVTTDHLLGLEGRKKNLEVTDLPPEDIELMQAVISALQVKNQNK